ncbi:hypothetical protein ASPVEDRAFT_36860 [Aspergillus versicolor CBS 583.65]|uniref:Uncharacterized protein n=1 Tax=Aspergillus versicolor CBS 583.65 TaxID=1036611 RepID=A0A1L9P7J0_ASPVE|nr:uncharacterized protein ASPVEDRAFT_36860 [Aspergillus versicolor CBS 583.65]OJI97446.1 hypothetical protein ASPVEDRAFT_36860 [Aspergillus versicolor CBS 583.65]
MWCAHAIFGLSSAIPWDVDLGRRAIDLLCGRSEPRIQANAQSGEMNPQSWSCQLHPLSSIPITRPNQTRRG